MLSVQASRACRPPTEAVGGGQRTRATLRAAARQWREPGGRRAQQQRQWRAAARMGHEDDDEDEDDFCLEEEGELDEADFVDLDQVKVVADQLQGPTYWSNYNTRFLSPDVVMLDQASQPPQHRLLQQQPNVQQLLARLPGIQQRQAQLAGQQPPAPAVGKRLPPRVAAVLQNAPLSPEDVPERHPLEEQMKVWDELWDPPPEPLDEWDLRAVMEKRRRKEREWSEWVEQRGRVGSQTNYWSDWRTDVRIKGTSDPTAPDYREWTHREIWDFITQNGLAADPRQVRHRTASPTELADLVEQGARFHPETEDWIASLGKLIQEEDEEAIIDREAEAALLDGEFMDFDEQFKDLSGNFGADPAYEGTFAPDDDY